MVMVGL